MLLNVLLMLAFLAALNVMLKVIDLDIDGQAAAGVVLHS